MAKLVRQSQKFGSVDEATTAAGAVTAKTESQMLVAANPDRVAVYITNDGANTVYLALGATATKNKGLRLNAEGGSFTNDHYTGVISVVTATGESVCTIAEI